MISTISISRRESNLSTVTEAEMMMKKEQRGPFNSEQGRI
jgi:hypothetical protein